MKKKYRLDVAICLLAPFIVCSIITYLFFMDNKVMYWIRELIMIIACFFECITLFEFKNNKIKDKGLISGLVVSLSISLFYLAGYTISFGKISNDKLRICALIIGSILVIAGVMLRYVAKKQLRNNFSQSVQIINNHRLITNGLYSIVRHPAYIGTFLIVLGAVFMYGNVFMLILILLILPLGIKRINYEESLLIKQFGEEYKEYQKHVNRFIPKISV